jgi:hypothetical protein
MKVKKKLLLMLASWKNQYQNDPSMSMFAGLYGQCRGVSRMQSPPAEASTVSNDTRKEEKKKAKQKQERERRNKEAEEARRKKTAKAGRVPFNLERVTINHCIQKLLTNNPVLFSRNGPTYSPPSLELPKHQVTSQML